MFFDSWFSLLRILIVGTAAYLGLVATLRISGKRTLSKMNAFDLVVTVAFGSALASTLLSHEVSVSEGVTAFALLAFLQFVITRSMLRWPRLEKVVKSDPTLLFFRGRILDDAITSERITRNDVLTAIRNEGFTNPDDVSAVVLEADGSFSVIGDGPVERVLEGMEGHRR